jgi:integrase
MNGFASERIGVQHEAEVRIFKVSVLAQQVASKAPQATIELVEHVLALDAYLLDYLLIEIVQELFASIALTLCDLRLEIALQLVERVHDLKHTYGRRLRAAGVPLETRRVLLGHKNGDITTHYSAPELQELIDAAERVCCDDFG